MRAQPRSVPAEGLYFEDFAVGDRFVSPAITVTESQIVDFALLYDPHPFHIDVEAGKRHAFGTLFASGAHTLALGFRLLALSRVIAASAVAGAGIDRLRWRKPVRPGDSLHLELEVLALRASASRPQTGILRLRHETVNQHGETVLSHVCTHIINRLPKG